MSRMLALLLALLISSVPGRASDPPGEKRPARDAYRYDGKTFDQWRTILLTELRTDKRVEALEAVSALAARGFGKEGAAAILQVVEDHLRDHDTDLDKNDKDRVLQGARAGLVKIQADCEPLLLEACKNGNDKVRYFCLDFFGAVYTNRPAVCKLSVAALPVLLRMVRDDDVKVSTTGLALLSGGLLPWDEDNLSAFHEAFLTHLREEAGAADFFNALGRTFASGKARPVLVSRWMKLVAQLGPLAKPAVPGLLQALAKTDHPAIVVALEKTGCDAGQIMPHLRRMLEKRQHLDVVMPYLGRLGPKARAATEPLLKMLADNEQPGPRRVVGPVLVPLPPQAGPVPTVSAELTQFGDRANAAQALLVLEKIGVGPDQIVSPLIAGMVERCKQNSDTVLAWELEYLGRMGPRAKDAVGGLAQILRMTSKAVDETRSTGVARATMAIVDGQLAPLFGLDPREPLVVVLGAIGPAAREALPALDQLARQCRGDDVSEANLATAIGQAVASIRQP